MSSHRFEGLPYSAEELSAYIFSIDTFIISLKNEEIVRFVAPEPDKFKQWLDDHRVRNVSETLGKMVYITTSRKKKGKSDVFRFDNFLKVVKSCYLLKKNRLC